MVAGQESWEKEDTKIDVEGYKWFGKPGGNQNSQRDEGGVSINLRIVSLGDTTASYFDSTGQTHT